MSKRTTLTLEDDVAAQLRGETLRTGKSIKQVANEALRAGLSRQASASTEFELRPRSLGLRPGFDLDDIWGLIGRLEGPFHR